MPSIPFDATNPFLKNRYASLGSVIEHSRPVLAKHGLSVCQPPINDGGAVGIESMLMHSSGEFVSSRFTLPLGEERGKSVAQVAGSVITYLRRYAWASMLGLYADEDTDGNEQQRPTAPAPRREAPVTPPAPQKPPKNDSGTAAEPSEKDLAEHKDLQTRLVKLCGAPMLPELIRALRGMPSKDGSGPMLGADQGIEALPLPRLRAMVNKWEEVYPKIDLWLTEHPAPEPPPPAEPPAKPAAPAEKPATSVWPEGTKTVTGVIVEVNSKSGGEGNKKWTRYGVHLDGTWYSTFSHDFGKQAQEWRGMLVTLAYTESAKGKNLVDLFLPEITP